MGVNSLTFEQASALLNAIHTQVTGEGPIAILDTATFVSVGQKTLAGGYDPVLNAITQMVGRTIFSSRAYKRKFQGIMMDQQRFGYITRKLAISDSDFEDDNSFDIQEGTVYTNMFKVRKPNVLELKYFGQAVWKKGYTVFRNQLNSAFQSPDQLGSFMAMYMTHIQNQLEQSREEVARATIINFMAGKIKADNGVIHCLTEYNTETGKSLTSTTVMAPENFPEFSKWLYARVATLSDMMTERTGLYQIQVTGNKIMRHTPVTDQKIYMLSKFLNAVKARVNADAFHDSYLTYADVEAVNFWQDTAAPAKIMASPSYLHTDGTVIEDEDGVTQDNILGVVFDREALGLVTMDEWSAASPLEASEGYYSTWYHAVMRFFNDFTEKGAVLILD